jgi:hypothetical protein
MINSEIADPRATAPWLKFSNHVQRCATPSRRRPDGRTQRYESAADAEGIQARHWCRPSDRSAPSAWHLVVRSHLVRMVARARAFTRSN